MVNRSASRCRIGLLDIQEPYTVCDSQGQVLHCAPVSYERVHKARRAVSTLPFE